MALDGVIKLTLHKIKVRQVESYRRLQKLGVYVSNPDSTTAAATTTSTYWYSYTLTPNLLLLVRTGIRLFTASIPILNHDADANEKLHTYRASAA